MTETNVVEARKRHDRERDRSTCRQFLRLFDVEAYTGLKRTALYKHIRAGEFPKPVSLTDTGIAKAWDLAELEAWRAARIAARDAAHAQNVACEHPDPIRPNTALLKRAMVRR